MNSKQRYLFILALAGLATTKAWNYTALDQARYLADARGTSERFESTELASKMAPAACQTLIEKANHELPISINDRSYNVKLDFKLNSGSGGSGRRPIVKEEAPAANQEAAKIECDEANVEVSFIVTDPDGKICTDCITSKTYVGTVDQSIIESYATSQVQALDKKRQEIQRKLDNCQIAEDPDHAGQYINLNRSRDTDQRSEILRMRYECYLNRATKDDDELSYSELRGRLSGTLRRMLTDENADVREQGGDLLNELASSYGNSAENWEVNNYLGTMTRCLGRYNQIRSIGQGYSAAPLRRLSNNQLIESYVSECDPSNPRSPLQLASEPAQRSGLDWLPAMRSYSCNLIQSSFAQNAQLNTPMPGQQQAGINPQSLGCNNIGEIYEDGMGLNDGLNFGNMQGPGGQPGFGYRTWSRMPVGSGMATLPPFVPAAPGSVGAGPSRFPADPAQTGGAWPQNGGGAQQPPQQQRQWNRVR